MPALDWRGCPHLDARRQGCRHQDGQGDQHDRGPQHCQPLPAGQLLARDAAQVRAQFRRWHGDATIAPHPEDVPHPDDDQHQGQPEQMPGVEADQRAGPDLTATHQGCV